MKHLNRSGSEDAKQTHLCMKALNSDVNRILGKAGFLLCNNLECESGNGEKCRLGEWEKSDNDINAVIVNMDSVSVVQSNRNVLQLAYTYGYVERYEIRGRTIGYHLENGKLLVCEIEE